MNAYNDGMVSKEESMNRNPKLYGGYASVYKVFI
jgi:hypothetical protein